MIKLFANHVLMAIVKGNRYTTVIAISALCLLLSCQDDLGQDSEDSNIAKSVLSNQHEMDNEFRALSKSLAEVFVDRSTIQDLYSYENANSGEININISGLLSGEYPGKTKESTSFQASLLRNLSSRKNGPDLFDELGFLVENDIELYAPYLSNTFSKDSLKSLTITYFYPGIYSEHEDDADFKGETPGFKYLFDENGKLDLKNPIEVIANDEYAELNPTIVLLPDESLEVAYEQGENLKLDYANASISSASPDCSDLSSKNEILTIRMPEFQLNGNIRRWPKPNEMYLWVSFGVITPSSNGTPTIGVSTSNPLARHEVSRRSARKKRWVSSNINFVVQNWKYESQDLHIVWGCTRTESTLTSEASVSVKDSQGTFSVKSSKVTKNTVELVTSVIYDKCALLYNNKHGIDQGYGIKNSVPVYNFNGVRTYFTFEKYNY